MCCVNISHSPQRRENKAVDAGRNTVRVRIHQAFLFALDIGISEVLVEAARLHIDLVSEYVHSVNTVCVCEMKNSVNGFLFE